MATFNTERLVDQSDIESLTDEWNQLAVACGAQPFALPAMGLAWHRHFGRGRFVAIAVRNGAGRLDGLLALDERRKGVVDVLEPLGQNLGGVTDFLTRPGVEGVAESLWKNLLADPRRSVYITDFVVGGSGLSTLRHGDDRWHAVLNDECPVIDLHGLNDAQEHLADPRRSNLRKKLRRADRLIGDRSFATTFEHGSGDAADVLDRLLPLYDRSHAAQPKLHLDRGRYRSFYREALAGLAAEQQLTIAVATLDDQPVAFDVYVVAGTTASAILGRYDPPFADISPGQLLTRAGIDWGISIGLDRIDLQLGGSLYKRRWATGSYDTVRVLAADEATFGRARAGVLALDGIHTAIEATTAIRTRMGRPPPSS